MTPKPIVEPMWYVWDWRGFIQKHLWPITYHTRYNSFKIEKQNGDVKFRCKRLPQSLKYGPTEGLKLVKEGIDLKTPIKSASFRIDSLGLDPLMLYITQRFKTSPLQERITTISNWDNVCKQLRDLPKKKDSLPVMSLAHLPEQQAKEDLRQLPQQTEGFHEEEICGHQYKDDIEEGDIEEVLPGFDVAVYTETKSGRPWVGRVVSIDKEKNEFEIHWFEKVQADSNKYVAMFKENKANIATSKWL